MTVAPQTQPTAHLTEVFSSVQGEGPYVGLRQIFVRFYGCHRRCVFCDSPETVTAWQPQGFRPATFKLEKTPGARDFEAVPNPITPAQLVQQIAAMDQPRGTHHSVACTGGEPLLHAPFLREFLPQIEHLGMRTYLETAGDLYHELEQLLPFVDIAAMDIKLPSVTKNEAAWGSHRHFLERCAQNDVDIIAKVIVSAETDLAELDQAAKLVRDTAPNATFIIQPMTPFGDAKNPPSPAQLLAWQTRVQEIVKHVRVIPQCHKMMNQL